MKIRKTLEKGNYPSSVPAKLAQEVCDGCKSNSWPVEGRPRPKVPNFGGSTYVCLTFYEEQQKWTCM